MTQDERWNIRYNEVKAFVENNKRRPSKYAPEERNTWNWLRHTQKQYNSGELKPERVKDFGWGQGGQVSVSRWREGTSRAA